MTKNISLGGIDYAVNPGLQCPDLPQLRLLLQGAAALCASSATAAIVLVDNGRAAA